MDEMKTRSIRASEETLEKFRILAESFENQGDCLSRLITAYEISTAKHTLTDLKADIADYESHIQSIQEAFLHILELNTNAEQRIKLEFTELLQSKDKTIAELQSRSEESARALQAAQDKAKEEIELNNINLDLEKQYRKDAEAEADRLRSANIDYSERAKLHEQLASERAAELERLRTDLAELQLAKDKLKALQEEHEAQAAELQRLKADIEKMKAESEYNKRIAEAELKAAIAETKAEYSEKLETLRAEKEELLVKLHEARQPEQEN